MATGIWVLGDQLWTGQAALSSCEQAKERTPVILVESRIYARGRPYHRQKLVLVWSAMRHFAQELRSEGWPVTYEIADDFQTPLEDWIENHKITELRVMSPNDRPFIQLIENLQLGCPIAFVPNNHFFWGREDFQRWADSRKRLLLEDFYREGRRRFKILMDAEKPIGGQWNFDKQNRQPPRSNLKTPQALWFEPDETTRSVIDEVNPLLSFSEFKK